MRSWTSVSPLVVVLLGGCVALQPPLLETAQPSAASAYVAGLFTREDPIRHRTGEGFALVLRDVESARDYAIPFDARERADGDRSFQAVLVEVPPGKYVVAAWTTYHPPTRAEWARMDIPAEHPLARSFEVGAGRVTILGAFAGESYRRGNTFHRSIESRSIDDEAAKRALALWYPEFASAPAACVACAWTPPAPTFGGPRPPALQLRPPTLQPPRRY